MQLFQQQLQKSKTLPHTNNMAAAGNITLSTEEISLIKNLANKNESMALSKKIRTWK